MLLNTLKLLILSSPLYTFIFKQTEKLDCNLQRIGKAYNANIDFMFSLTKGFEVKLNVFKRHVENR